MSQPEWMQKFNQIGQKQEEEVTSYASGSVVKTGEASGEFVPKKPESSGDDDAAALFAAAGSKPDEDKDDGGDDEPGRIFAATPSEDNAKEEEDDDEAARLFAAAGPTDTEEIIEEEIIEEEVVIEESVVEESITTASASKEVTEAGASQNMTDDEFGERWVVDKDKIKAEVTDTQFEEVEVEKGAENVHYEEVIVDEDGNEVVVQNSDEEEVIVDEDGNEIVEEVIEEEAPAEPVYDPAYDVENQKKLLGRGSKAYRSKMACWVPYLLILAFAAGVLCILFFIILADDDVFRPSPTLAPSPGGFLPLEPTNNGLIDVAATTELDPVTGQCDFSELDQPNVVDQCSCTGRISIIADDVRARYGVLKEEFIVDVIPGFDEEIDSCDASNQALVWLSSGTNNAAGSPDFVMMDRYALAYFYIQQGGTGWIENDLWLSQLDACLWFGVSCNDDFMVTEVDVSRNGLIGQLSEAVGLLTSLETLSVSGNSLAGTIPPELVAVESLRAIDLSNNAFFGTIPPFPDSSSLERIEFQSNNLSGELESSIADLENLRSLNVANNALNGPLPPSIFDSTSLIALYVSQNAFNGEIPQNIGNAGGLVDLALGPNDFTGSIPTSLGQLTNLNRLLIEDVEELEGRLPASYGFGLTNLVEFVLTGTSVRGNIPDTFGSMTALTSMNFANNNLERQLPSTLGALINLRKLHLQENAFTGTIPPQLGNAEALTELQLNDNQLIGTVPSTLGLLQDLTALTLESNFLDGRAPEEVCDLRGEELAEFTVDCPERVNDAFVVGVICSIPSCCTACF